jgi:sirohydrochlorin cobaltochelatase
MSDPTRRALILFAHGARDARWSRTLGDLAGAIRARDPQRRVATAFLEFQPPTLQEALAETVRKGCTRIEVLPVFWASGGHVANDLPPLLESFRAAHPEVSVQLLPVLSELPGLLEFIAQAVAERELR